MHPELWETNLQPPAEISCGWQFCKWQASKSAEHHIRKPDTKMLLQSELSLRNGGIEYRIAVGEIT